VPHMTDNPGAQRTTTVNSTTLMSWPPPRSSSMNASREYA
jgi:hypothetical protein